MKTIDQSLNIADLSMDDEFNFEQWRTLYETDPEAFEAKRLEVIERTILQAPEAHQRRLRGLMFEVEARRARAKTPMESCIAISSMMWDKFEQLRVQLNKLSDPEALDNVMSGELEKPKSSARVIAFRR